MSLMQLFFKVYLFLLGKNIHLLKRIRYSFPVIAGLKSIKGGLWLRDGNSENWLETFFPYISEKKFSEDLFSGMDESGKDLGKYIQNKTGIILRNNIISYGALFNEKEVSDQTAFGKFASKKENRAGFDITDISSLLNLFYEKQLFQIPDIESYLKDKDIIDCGAYVGDSAYLFSRAFPESKNIYSFEPNSMNYGKLKNTISRHGLESKVILVNKGVGDSDKQAIISEGGLGSTISETGETIDITSIDSFSRENGVIPGLIKWDIEGLEYESILGAKEIIIKHKPILFISIYHTGKDFYEIKPLLESWNVGYRFTMQRWNCFHPFADTLLICY